MPERARDARVKPWQQAAQGLVSVLHVVRPPTRSLCTTTASARHVPARQHQSSRPIPRNRRRSRRWSRWAAIARSNCTLGACCWPSKCPQPRSLACILTYGTSPGHNQQQRSRSRAYSGSGSNRRPRVVVMKADFERALLEQATEASGTRVVVDVRAPKDAVAARASRWIDARGRRRGQVSGIS